MSPSTHATDGDVFHDVDPRADTAPLRKKAAPVTSEYRRDKRAIVGWIATTLAGLAIVAAGWAHGKLWGQDQRLTAVETHQSNDKELLREVRDDVKQILQRMPR